MGYVELEARIRADHMKAVGELKVKAEEEAAKIMAEAKAAAYAASERVRLGGERRAALIYRQVVGQARLEAMRAMGSEKNRLVEKVFAEAARRVMSLPHDKKAGLVRRLAEDARLIGGRKKVRVNRGFGGVLVGLPDSEVVEEDFDCLGVIISSEDGAVTIDNRLSSVLGQSKPRLTPEVNVILFGENELQLK